MNRDSIKKSFDKIKADEQSKDRIFNRVLEQKKEKRRFGLFTGLKLGRVIPVLVLVLLLVGGVAIKGVMPTRENTIAGDSPGKELVDNTTGGDAIVDIVPGEDFLAPIANQFQIGDRHYQLMQADLIGEFNLPSQIKSSDIGQEIAVIDKSPDESLLGKKVYSYIPAGCEAVVAVLKDGEYSLYTFLAFESYMNNQDEDAARYLDLYGIKAASDIGKIQFIGYSEEAKLRGEPDIKAEISDPDEIKVFYHYYSSLKNSSDKYFDKLFNQRLDKGRQDKQGDFDLHPPDLPVAPDEPSAIDPNVYEGELPRDVYYGDKENEAYAPDSTTSSGTVVVDPVGPMDGYLVEGEDEPRDLVGIGSDMVDYGDTYPGSTRPSQGSASNELANSVLIRIYNQKGVFIYTTYYIDFGFISRFEVGSEFARFLENYIK